MVGLAQDAVPSCGGYRLRMRQRLALGALVPPLPDTLLAGAIFGIAQIETWLTAPEAVGVYAVAAAAMTVPLAWRRMAPVTVSVLAFGVLVIMDLTGRGLDSAYIMAVLIVAFYSVGAYLERRQAVAGWAIAVALLAVLIGVESGPGAGDFLFVGSIVSGAWALGMGLRSRSEEGAAHAERADRLQLEREALARQAVADERARIARELHDVIAHAMTIVVVQTSALRRKLLRQQADEDEQLQMIEQTGRQALQEMRRLLGILRTEETELDLSPTPGLADVPDLLRQLREAGLEVDVRVEGQPRPLPVGLDLTAYRVVQEALINVLKHAGTARTTLTTRYDDAHLDVVVSNWGGRPVTTSLPGGHGLVGMRERVLLYGGSFDCGPVDDGFVVHARLPLGDP